MATKRKAPTAVALARLKVQLEKVRRTARPELLPAVIPQQQLTPLDDTPQYGLLGLQPLTLTAEAEAILAEPINPLRVSIKPTGAVYYSHIEYTWWFNRAFGRAQWHLKPVTKPQLSPVEGREEQLATQTFLLFVHGKPVAQATGEQEYSPSNRDQSFADVLESLNASALRRVAKRLGVGLELWDRPWTEEWRDQFAVRVWLDGKPKPVWRRKDARPFWNERGVQQGHQATEQRAGETKPVHPPRGGEGTISDAQRKRLWAIFKKSGRDEADLKAWLAARFGIDSTNKIQRGWYDEVISAIEASGDFPLVDAHTGVPLVDEIPWGAREPGEEG